MSMAKNSLIGALIIQGTIILLNLLSSFGVEMSADMVSSLTALAGFLGIIITFILWMKTVPKDKVLEVLIGEEVVAGPANDMAAEGDTIRIIGEPRRAINESLGEEV